MLTEEQIAEIRARAEAATPGPWYHCQPFQTVPAQRTIHGPVPEQRVDYVSTWEGPGTAKGHSVVAHMDGREAGMRSRDMAFIAAANPAVVLALLSALEAAQSANRPRDDYPVFCSDCGRAHVLDTVLPSEIWNKIASPDDLLCVVCIDTRLKKAGLTAEAEFYYSGDALRSRLYGDADALDAANKRADEAEARADSYEGAARHVALTVQLVQSAIDELTVLRARVAVMQEALEIIAGKRQCLDNLMGNKDVALAALKGASHEQG